MVQYKVVMLDYERLIYWFRRGGDELGTQKIKLSLSLLRYAIHELSEIRTDRNAIELQLGVF